MVIGALGPLMLKLAREETSGALPFLVPPEHTEKARSILGADSWLAVEQMALLETDPAKARERGRAAITSYLTAPGYRRNIESLGFSAEEMDSKSDRLVDALIAWGDEASIRARISSAVSTRALAASTTPAQSNLPSGNPPSESINAAFASPRSNISPSTGRPRSRDSTGV